MMITTHRILTLGGAVLLALALSAALAGAQTSGAPTTAASYVPPTDSISGQSMLELVIRSNREVVRQSRIAASASRNADVRRFAETLVDEHSAALAGATSLWTRLGYTMADSVTTLSSVGTGSDAGLGAGLGRTDEVTDNAYLTSEVTSLQSLSTQLQQRTATDPSVRAFAAEFRTTVERQLTDAKRLQTPSPTAP